MKPVPKIVAILLTTFPLLSAPAVDLYKTKCAMCHGADGSGNTPMGKKLGLADLRAKNTQSQADAQLMAVVETGKGKMPGQKDRLSKEEIRQLVAYIRDLAKKH